MERECFQGLGPLVPESDVMLETPVAVCVAAPDLSTRMCALPPGGCHAGSWQGPQELPLVKVTLLGPGPRSPGIDPLLRGPFRAQPLVTGRVRPSGLAYLSL